MIMLVAATLLKALDGIAMLTSSTHAPNSWAIVVGEEGNVFKSHDYGATWNCSLCGPERLTRANLNSVHFISSNLGFVAGNNGTVLKTVNQGLNWTHCTTAKTASQSLDLYGVFMQKPLVVYAVGAQGLLLHTDDGGLTWTAHRLTIPDDLGGMRYAPRLKAIRFADTHNAILLGGCNEWLISSDAGRTWIPLNLSDIDAKSQRKKSAADHLCRDYDWASAMGATCHHYQAQEWCNEDGTTGTGWSSSWGTFSDYRNIYEVDAAEACCACGGGHRRSELLTEHISSVGNATLARRSLLHPNASTPELVERMTYVHNHICRWGVGPNGDGPGLHNVTYPQNQTQQFPLQSGSKASDPFIYALGT
jgi:hypothetical protein